MGHSSDKKEKDKKHSASRRSSRDDSRDRERGHHKRSSGDRDRERSRKSSSHRHRSRSRSRGRKRKDSSRRSRSKSYDNSKSRRRKRSRSTSHSSSDNDSSHDSSDGKEKEKEKTKKDNHDKTKNNTSAPPNFAAAATDDGVAVVKATADIVREKALLMSQQMGLVSASVTVPAVPPVATPAVAVAPATTTKRPSRFQPLAADGSVGQRNSSNNHTALEQPPAQAVTATTSDTIADLNLLDLDNFEEHMKRKREQVRQQQLQKNKLDIQAQSAAAAAKLVPLPTAASSSLFGSVTLPGGNKLNLSNAKRKTGWTFDDDDDDDVPVAPKPKKAASFSLSAVFAGSNEVKNDDNDMKVDNGSSSNKKDEEMLEETAEEFDPLDAFMQSLNATHTIETQDAMNSAFGMGDTSGKLPPLNPYGSNTISLSDIMKGNIPESGWESDTVGPQNPETETEDSGDEEKLEQDRIAFMEAFKRNKMVSNDNETEETKPKEQQNVDKEPEEEKGKKQEDFGRIFGHEGDVMDEDERYEQEASNNQMMQEAMKKKELKPVDHSKIDYIHIRKNLYIVPRQLASMKEEEVKKLRDSLEIKVRGKNCPTPIEFWEQCGLSDRMLQLIRKLNYTAPFAIQRQAIPAIMAGRDVIGVAKTGSGKTLAFILPMLRHILDQPPRAEGEGPIGVIMAPARELAVQIYTEAKKFTKSLGLRVCAVYGGAGVAEQIADLKRGADIVVATPGRMIDILTMQAGKVLSLSRVSYLVMDEADRMFDMGFEPQINMIVKNIRPDRQTVLFSATFPRVVEQLAKKVLKFPLEIIVGGRSVASSTITQYVEVREEDDKYLRLLQLLGLWYERGNVLIFVDTQQKCDQLFQDLLKNGYPCLSLHGGKDQIDRDYTIQDFKQKIKTVLVATTLAGRGLDVPDLVCVINYSVPNHLEDYVHRVGRTGRAGRKGTAYTFITPQEDQYAPLLVKALTESGQDIPEELQKINDNFVEKVDKGEAKWASKGFSGKGFTFTEDEKTDAQKMKDQARTEILGTKADEDEELADDEGDEEEEKPKKDNVALDLPGASLLPTDLARAKAIALGLAAKAVPGAPVSAAVARAQAAALAHQLSNKQVQRLSQQQAPNGKEIQEHIQVEVEINDYPQQARWKVTHKDSVEAICDMTGANIIPRGLFYPPGRNPPAGERKLHLVIEGPDQNVVSAAKSEVLRILREESMRTGPGTASYGKYSVI